MSRAYLNHGLKHANGEDPIPGLGGGGIKWAYISGNSTTIAANGGSGSTATTLKVNSNANFYTNDSSIFGCTSTTVSGVTIYGINYLAVGHYLVFAQADGSSVPTSAAYSLEEHSTNTGSSSGWSLVPFMLNYAQVLSSLNSGGLNSGFIHSVDGSTFTTPTGPVTFQITNYSNTTFSRVLGYWVMQLDTDGTLLV